MGYKTTWGTAYVKGESKYEGSDVAPLAGDNSASVRTSDVPMTEWDGRTIGFNKNAIGVYTTTSKTKNLIDVAASLVQYKNGTVTELEQLKVNGIKFKDKKALKNASVTYKTVEEKVKLKTLDGDNKEVDNGEDTLCYKK